ncbi:MAG TPA: DEAD/DEAH box helicase [Bacilli bacterium]|nr:DEAD/DEAH box helicase [Bacilli bacterium]
MNKKQSNNFKIYNFKEYLYKGLESISFVNPTEIQDIVINKIKTSEHLIATSQTGTGKTHAFLLPLLDGLTDDDCLQALIIVPTRELAFQINEDIENLTKFSPTPIDTRLYVGGSNRDTEIKKLAKSQPQIAIGTLGKIKDLAVTTNVLKIHTAKMVIIDEADMVFESSEIVIVDQVFSRFEAPQILVFSATISQELTVFLNKYLTNCEKIDLIGKKLSKSSIEHVFIPTKNKNKDDLLVALLKTFNPYLALIFANTKVKVDEIADYLSASGFKVGKITGDLAPRERKQMIKRIKDGVFQYVVASDIASRGIDIIGVSHVVNYELPKDIEFYIHRIGRTARFEATGIAISFYDFDDDNYLDQLHAKGFSYVYKALKDGELKETKERNAKKARTTPRDEVDLHAKIPLPKKVKPGYKKKRNEEIAKEARKVRRSRLSEIYRRRARKDEDR